MRQDSGAATHRPGGDPRRSVQRSLIQNAKRTVKTSALIASLILGAHLMAAGIESPRHAWLGLFSLVPLFLVIRLWRPPLAMLGGMLWGLSLYLSSSGSPEAVVSPTVQSFALLAVVPASYAFLGAWLTRRIGFNPFVLGFAWMGVEFALGPVGLSTGLLGGGQEDPTILRWVGGALGYVLVAFVIALASASLVSVLSRARLSIPQVRHQGAPCDFHLTLFPQTFFGSSFFLLPPLQPRAPPPTWIQ